MDVVLGPAQAALVAATEASRRISEQRYRVGVSSYLEVLDAQRTLFELQGERIDLLAAYGRGVADVERLCGTSLEGEDR